MVYLKSFHIALSDNIRYDGTYLHSQRNRKFKVNAK